MSPVASLCFLLAKAALGLAVLLVLVALVRRPTLPDRMVALDFLSTAVIGLIVLAGYREAVDWVLVPGIAMALVSFVAMVALARVFGNPTDGMDH